MPEDVDISDLLGEPPKSKTSQALESAGAFAEGVADTASGGFVDEAVGVGAGGIEGTNLGRWLGEKFGLLSRDAEGNLIGGDGRVLENANGTPGDTSFGSAYRAGRESKREDIRQLQAEHGTAFKAGQVAGAVASTVVVPMAAGRTARAAQVLAEGGVRGLGASEADLTQGEVIDAAKDFARGAALAAPAAALGALAPRGTTPAAPAKAGTRAAARRPPGAGGPVAAPAAAAKAPSALADAAAGAAVGYAADEVLKRFGKDTGIPLPLIAAALAVARGKAGGKLGGSTYQQFANMARGKITPEAVRVMTQTMPEAATRAFYDELGRAAEPAIGPITKKLGADTDVDISDLL